MIALIPQAVSAQKCWDVPSCFALDTHKEQVVGRILHSSNYRRATWIRCNYRSVFPVRMKSYAHGVCTIKKRCLPKRKSPLACCICASCVEGDKSSGKSISSYSLMKSGIKTKIARLDVQSAVSVTHPTAYGIPTLILKVCVMVTSKRQCYLTAWWIRPLFYNMLMRYGSSR